MDIFEYFRTSFHVMKAFASQDRIIYIGLGVLGLFILWSVLSLLFCHEARVVRIWKKMRKTINIPAINADVYFAFTKYFAQLPSACARKWRKYERIRQGVASDYLTQEDMLDNPMSGGITKQNRSIMKFAMGMITILFFLLSLGSLGGESNITAQLLCESMLVPFVLFLLYRVNYYVYTVIRQHQYRMAVEEFQDFLDFVDNKIDLIQIFDGNESVLDISSNCYRNDIDFEKKINEREQIQELEKKEIPSKEEIIEQENQVDFYRNKVGDIEIRTQDEFVNALGIVEKLLDQKSENTAEQDEKTKKLAELMAAMNKYRNKKIK